MTTDLIVLIGLIGIGWYVWTHTDLLDSLKGGGGGGATGGGGPAGDCGSTVYPASGGSWTAKDSGKTKRDYASGKKSTGTTQWDASGVNATNLEATVYLNVGKCADEVAIKVWGPSHNDGNCCWASIDVDCKSGRFCVGGEGPHPDINKSVKCGSSMGSIQNKDVGIKIAIYKTGSTIHVEGYGDVGGTWKKMVEWTGTQVGFKKKSSSPAKGATAQFRIDCNGVKIKCTSIKEINPSGGGGGGSSKTSAKKSKAKFAYEYTGNFQYLQQPRISNLKCLGNT